MRFTSHFRSLYLGLIYIYISFDNGSLDAILVNCVPNCTLLTIIKFNTIELYIDGPSDGPL